MTTEALEVEAGETDSPAIDSIEQWAGHFAQGGSDKVWGGAVQGATFISTWGKRGSALQRGEKVCKSNDEALKLFRKKAQEKASEGYKTVAFGDPAYGIPVLIGPAAGGSVSVTVTTTVPPKPTVYATGHVLPMEEAELEACLASPLYGVSEKINGERCVVAFDGATLTAYNRKGQQVSTVPDSTRALAALGHPFVLDGERMIAGGVGGYVIFDLLEWEGRDMRAQPYGARITAVRDALVDQGLAASVAHSVEPDDAADMAGPRLCLLTAEVGHEEGRALVDRVAARGGEGVVIRTLDAPYVEGDTKHVRKIKFLADLDAFVIRVNPGKATGSVVLGLVRPDDGAVIEVCNVRSGLTDPDITALEAKLAAGERPVLTVEYLPARTVGIRLVEPKVRTLGSAVRTDKTWQECHTTQLGTAKADDFARAKPANIEARQAGQTAANSL